MSDAEQRRLQYEETERRKEEARRERRERAQREDAELREGVLKRHFEVAEQRQAEKDFEFLTALERAKALKRPEGG